VKAAVQLTSTSLPAAGLLTGGAGSLNAFAAVVSVRSPLTSQAETTEFDSVETSKTIFAPLDLANHFF